MHRLMFSFMITPGETELDGLMLAGSIRAFAGEFRDAPIRVLIPEVDKRLSEATRTQLESMDARLIRFPIDQATFEFPYAGKVFASAIAESQAAGEAEVLAWMDVDSIVTGDPAELLLNAGQDFGYRPVDHTLIGSPDEEPVDSFWTLIYEHCGVSEDRPFPMTATVDEKRIRPYFNGGIAVVRPQRGLLRAWRDAFDRLYREASYEDFYQRDALYRTFMHQAVLAGTVLATMESAAMRELSYRVAYPLHMHADYPVVHRPAHINDLVSCRHDVFFRHPNWEETLPARGKLREWIIEQRELKV